MATVYKIEIQTTSEFVNYSPEYIEEVLKEILEDFEMINTTVKAERIA